MRILAVGDLHGHLESVSLALDRWQPDGLVCVGDWGDDEQVVAAELARLVGRCPTLTVFGNHDPQILGQIRDRDDRPALLAAGEVRDWLGIRVAGISGIWAKSHRKPYYVTDDDVAELARQITAQRPVDLLLTHGCPVGLADQTPAGARGGQRCFLLANQQIAPRVHLCGHVHHAQERTLRDGRQILNVGPTPAGSVVLIEIHADQVVARLARTDEPEADPR